MTAPGGTGAAAAGPRADDRQVAQSRVEQRTVILTAERETDGIGRQAAVYAAARSSSG
jgi:hypothetical protein